MNVQDFTPGQRVAHITLGDGMVTAVDTEVHVTYDWVTAHGDALVVTYDKHYFAVCPDYLFQQTKEGT